LGASLAGNFEIDSKLFLKGPPTHHHQAQGLHWRAEMARQGGKNWSSPSKFMQEYYSALDALSNLIFPTTSKAH
jgi:hypothetical protein